MIVNPCQDVMSTSRGRYFPPHLPPFRKEPTREKSADQCRYARRWSNLRTRVSNSKTRWQFKKSEPKFDYAMVSNPTPTVGSNSFVLGDYSKVSPPAQEVEVVFVSTNVGTFVVNRKQAAQFNQSNVGAPYPGSFDLTGNKLNFNWTIQGDYGTVVKVLGLTAIYKQ
jgi:hypothetical protein